MASGWSACGTIPGCVTTYVWAWDDGPPGAELDPVDEEAGVPLASLDCTATQESFART